MVYVFGALVQSLAISFILNDLIILPEGEAGVGAELHSLYEYVGQICAMETPAFCLPRHGYLRRLDKEGLILPEGKDGAAAQQQVHDQRHATFQLLLQQYLYYQQTKVYILQEL